MSEPLLFVDGRASEIPCCLCGRKVVEFTIPNDIWNIVIRNNGSEHDMEYLCVWCVLADMVDYIRRQQPPKGLEGNN